MPAFPIPPDKTELTSDALAAMMASAANLSLTSAQSFAGALAVPTITNSGASIVNVTTFAGTGGYSITATDYIVKIKKTVAATTTVTLPSSPVTGRTLIIKDGAGNANSFNITITGSVNIDGAASLILNQPYASASLTYDGAIWLIT